jgi:hypothetical protein
MSSSPLHHTAASTSCPMLLAASASGEFPPCDTHSSSNSSQLDAAFNSILTHAGNGLYMCILTALTCHQTVCQEQHDEQASGVGKWPMGHAAVQQKALLEKCLPPRSLSSPSPSPSPSRCITHLSQPLTVSSTKMSCSTQRQCSCVSISLRSSYVCS